MGNRWVPERAVRDVGKGEGFVLCSCRYNKLQQSLCLVKLELYWLAQPFINIINAN